MMKFQLKGQHKPLFLILPILVLLLVGSIMIHRFYRSLANNAIQDEKRRLDSLVYRTYFRESQRMGLLLQALEQLPPEKEALKQSLISLIEIYGMDSEESGLIHTIGFTEAENPENLLIVNRSGLWQTMEAGSETYGQKGDRILLPYTGDTRFFVRKDGSADLIKVVFLHTPHKQKRYTAFLELNWYAFEKNFITPGLEEQLESYDLSWNIKDMPPPKEETLDVPGGEDFPFHPVRALLGRDHSSRIDHMIILPNPLFMDRPVLKGEETDIKELPDFMKAGRRDRYPDSPEGRYLSIGLEENPFYLQIEKQYALYWLQSMVILVGITLIFLLAMVQMIRLSRIRNQEKEFVASMTHELRTPLTVIQSASDNLSGGIVPPGRTIKYGELIRDQVKRLSHMIEEILQFSSMEGQPVKDEQIPMRGTEIIENVMESVRGIAERRGITLILESGLEDRECLGDPDLLRLGLNNLLMNSMYHAYGSTPGIIRVKAKTGIPDALVIIVEDEGRGIPGKEQKKIFTPFFRGRYSRENQEKGSGLGLFIVSRKLQAAGGTIKLESPYRTPGGNRQQGCRFTLRFPCRFT